MFLPGKTCSGPPPGHSLCNSHDHLLFSSKNPAGSETFICRKYTCHHHRCRGRIRIPLEKWFTAHDQGRAARQRDLPPTAKPVQGLPVCISNEIDVCPSSIRKHVPVASPFLSQTCTDPCLHSADRSNHQVAEEPHHLSLFRFFLVSCLRHGTRIIKANFVL